MFTINDVSRSYDSEGHPVYSLPNGDSVTAAGRLTAGNLSGQYGNLDGSSLAFINGNADSYVNAVNQQALWNREDKLREEAKVWDSKSIDRLVAAAQRNGINPIFLLDAVNGGMSSASYSTSAAKANNYDTNERTNQANSAKVAGSLIAAFALLLASFAK